MRCPAESSVSKYVLLHSLQRVSRLLCTMATESEVRAIWGSCDCVCFDVDSTVCVDEGIDELAAFMGKGQEVADLSVHIYHYALFIYL